MKLLSLENNSVVQSNEYSLLVFSPDEGSYMWKNILNYQFEQPFDSLTTTGHGVIRSGR